MACGTAVHDHLDERDTCTEIVRDDLPAHEEPFADGMVGTQLSGQRPDRLEAALHARQARQQTIEHNRHHVLAS